MYRVYLSHVSFSLHIFPDRNVTIFLVILAAPIIFHLISLSQIVAVLSNASGRANFLFLHTCHSIDHSERRAKWAISNQNCIK